MKLSQILYKQHIGRLMRRIWYIQGKVNLMPTSAEKHLTERGIEVVDAETILKPERKKLDLQFNFLATQPIPNDETHPDWKDRPCSMVNDNATLIEGLPQAQIITKTIIIDNSLPANIEALLQETPEQKTDQLVKRIIESSIIFDAHQELLPKLKDPKKPTWVFPRQYGITDVRKTYNLSKKLLQLCDCISGPKIASSRSTIDNALLCLPFEKEFELFKFSLTMDILLMSDKPIKSNDVDKNVCDSLELPSLHPMHHTIGMSQYQIYKFEDKYPLMSAPHKKNIHTVFLIHDKTSVKNITELEVTESQMLGRAMLKAFTAAASSAKQKYGSDVKDLPEPETVQCVYSNGKTFYFSVYQLNTLNLEGDSGVKNYSWILPKLDMYEVAGYQEGKPVLSGYNPEVFRRILAFYKNN